VLELSRKEFDVLHLLVQRVGQVVSKREMLAEVWRQPFYTTDKTVDVHISWLRRKLGESAEAPRYIHSVRGVGIKLVVPSGSSDPSDPSDLIVSDMTDVISAGLPDGADSPSAPS
jgi:DNA-binding winged helix-turn-helix (wHTH) protein